MDLTPCPGCARHVRSSEPACPFCGEVVTLRPSPPLRRVAGLSRIALFTFGTMAASSCGVTGNGEEPEQEQEETIMQPYGAPPDPEPVEPEGDEAEDVEPEGESGPAADPPAEDPADPEAVDPEARTPVQGPEAPSIAAYGTPAFPDDDLDR